MRCELKKMLFATSDSPSILLHHPHFDLPSVKRALLYKHLPNSPSLYEVRTTNLSSDSGNGNLGLLILPLHVEQMPKMKGEKWSSNRATAEQKLELSRYF